MFGEEVEFRRVSRGVKVCQ